VAAEVPPFARGETDIHVPDGLSLDDALARTTDLGVGAHADDLEFFAIGPIGECHARSDRWFGGVTCTDGAGSTPAEPGGSTEPSAGDRSLVEQRRAEQRAAADVGGYSFVAQLGHPSAAVRTGDGFEVLVGQLAEVLDRARPLNVYTHNLADKHGTHVAVGAAVVHAARRLPIEARPARLVGCEAWRDLDWLPDPEKVRMDASRHTQLAERLAAVYVSQLGAKRYDLAAQGRRRANATMFEPRAADDATEVVVAMDLTSLLRNDDLDPVRFVLSAVDRFRDDVERGLRRYV
jgi:LmbE family N-acetylglucosaminyl deacetylase